VAHAVFSKFSFTLALTTLQSTLLTFMSFGRVVSTSVH